MEILMVDFVLLEYTHLASSCKFILKFARFWLESGLESGLEKLEEKLEEKKWAGEEFELGLEFESRCLNSSPSIVFDSL